MRLTVHSSLAGSSHDVELDVRAGTSLEEILRYAGSTLREAWCGGQFLHASHPVGVDPLVHGGLLRDTPGEPTSPLRARHLAVVAGPDTGLIVPLDAPRVWGRAMAGVDNSAEILLADPLLSRKHARISPHESGAIITDLGSRNGSVRGGTSPLVALLKPSMLIGADDVAKLGSSWVTVRDPEAAQTVPTDTTERPPHRGLDSKMAGMTGGAISAVVLAAMTGRWYLALLALIYPLIVLAPGVLNRLWAPPPDVLNGLPLMGDEPPAWTTTPTVITGDLDFREATARAIILARGRRPPSHPHALAESWLTWLPPARPHDAAIILADQPASWCDTHVVAQPHATVVLRRGAQALNLAPLRCNPERAEAAARRIAATPSLAALPPHVRWADLISDAQQAPTTRREFRVPIGLSSDGEHHAPWYLDLDADGPHFLVAGTTGSGKSAFLETLVLALAFNHGPESLQIAILDFKGGAGLASCLGLPHLVGTVTDLDGRQARRALAALEAALRERKHLLAHAGHPSFAAWENAGGAPPRLMVVVDEFQEVGLLHRDFMPGINRLAAQGRSLGIHVVLATQRPSGAVTPEIRANTTTTIALRVASEAESRDLIGTSHASTLPADAPGRAIAATASSRTEIQVALPLATPSPAITVLAHGPIRANAPDGSATPVSGSPHSLAELAARAHRDATPASALWHPPLPSTVSPDHLSAPAGHLALGLEDWPEQRLRGPLMWDPSAGPFVVVSPPGTLRSAALDLAARAAVTAGLTPVWLPEDSREATRTLHLAHQRTDILLLIPDAPAALAALARVDRGIGIELLQQRAHSGRALALAVHPSTSHRIAQHAGLRLVAAHLSTQDEALWAVPRDLSDVEGTYAVRAWSAAGWREATVATPNGPEPNPMRLVTPLPDASDVHHLLGSSATRAAGEGATPDDRTPLGQTVVGIGGDHATPITVHHGESVALVGSPGREMDSVMSLLSSAGAKVSATVDMVALLPPSMRGGLVVAVEPAFRTAEELCRSDPLGLVEPTPQPGRVLWVKDGVGRCAQLATSYVSSSS